MNNARCSITAAAAFALSVVAGCATDLDSDDADFVVDAAAVLDEGVIVGDLDWVNASTLTGVAKTAAKATGYVSIPESRARCSGFLIGRDLLMTNNHCIPDAGSAVGVKVNFKYDTTFDTSGLVACDEFIGTNAALDYTIVRCTGLPGDTYGWLTIDPVALGAGDPIQLLHQQCDYATAPACAPTKKLSPGKILATTRIANRVTHDADMLGGSSGGAIVAPNSTNVIAINNAHVVPDNTGRGTTNIGVPMSLIGPDLRSRFPDLFEALPCDSIPAAGRIIEEDDSCVTLGGEARFFRSVEGAGYDNDLLWTGTTSNSTAGNFAEYKLSFATAGRFEIGVYIDATVGTASRARYTVRHSGGSTDVVVNQGTVSASGFFSLGTFNFAAGAGHSVRVNDNTGDRSQQLVIDAVLVKPVTVAAPPTSTATCTQVRVTGAESLNVRPDPNTSRGAVGVLQGGQVVNRTGSVTGQVVRGTNVWYAISTTGITGYISASYATCVN